MLFFMPIPIAVLFDSFRKERADIIVTDLLKQKQSLMFCFICLDVDKDNLVDLPTFKAMMDYAFNHRLSEENILEVYKSVCPDLTIPLRYSNSGRGARPARTRSSTVTVEYLLSRIVRYGPVSQRQ